MMTNALISHLVDLLQAQGGEAFKTVQPYGGEFTEEEVKALSFTCPAALPSVLGWRKTNNARLGGNNVYSARAAVFVVVKHTQRPVRFSGAMQRAELVSSLLPVWRPPGCFGQIDEIRAENLYSRKLDQKGLALWVVTWWHELKFDPANKPNLDDLPDLTGVDIDSQARTEIPDAGGPVLPPPDVNHELEINNNG